MRVKHWLLVLIISAPVIKADNSSFVDEHFIQDSALVVLNGAVVSVILETICWKTNTLPESSRAAFCQKSAPEATAFLYLTKSQWPTDAMETWSFLNMALLAGTLVYINHSPGLPIHHVCFAMTCMVYQQIIQIMVSTATRCLTGSNQTVLSSYGLINGVSTGLISGGLSLCLMYKQASEFKPSVLLIVSVGATLASTFLYSVFAESEKISLFDTVDPVAIFVVVAVAGAGAVIGGFAGAGIEAMALAAASAATAAVNIAVCIVIELTVTVIVAEAKAAGAGVIAVARHGAIAGAGAVAGAGAIIVVIIRYITSTLSQCSSGLPIARSLSMITAAGLPLMMSAWLVSWERFVEADVTAHETMQNEFNLFLKGLKDFYPEDWMIEMFNVWE